MDDESRLRFRNALATSPFAKHPAVLEARRRPNLAREIAADASKWRGEQTGAAALLCIGLIVVGLVIGRLGEPLVSRALVGLAVLSLSGLVVRILRRQQARRFLRGAIAANLPDPDS